MNMLCYECFKECFTDFEVLDICGGCLENSLFTSLQYVGKLTHALLAHQIYFLLDLNKRKQRFRYGLCLCLKKVHLLGIGLLAFRLHSGMKDSCRAEKFLSTCIKISILPKL
jgi:hypothetical protein